MKSTESQNFEQLALAASNFAKTAAAALAPFFKAVSEFAETLGKFVRSEYEKAGMPYGDSHEGAMRWFEEVCAAQRLRNEAQEIEERHWVLAETRKQIQNYARQ